MVSESVSWPVSMMIGALKPPLRRERTTSRPSVSGKPDVHQHQVRRIGLGGAGALGASIDCGSLELVVQRELLHQGVAQIGVVIHDQDLAGIGHDQSS